MPCQSSSNMVRPSRRQSSLDLLLAEGVECVLVVLTAKLDLARTSAFLQIEDTVQDFSFWVTGLDVP